MEPPIHDENLRSTCVLVCVLVLFFLSTLHSLAFFAFARFPTWHRDHFHVVAKGQRAQLSLESRAKAFEHRRAAGANHVVQQRVALVDVAQPDGLVRRNVNAAIVEAQQQRLKERLGTLKTLAENAGQRSFSSADGTRGHLSSSKPAQRNHSAVGQFVALLFDAARVLFVVQRHEARSLLDVVG